MACLAIGAKKRMDNNIKQVFAQRAINFLRHATRVTTHVQAELRIVCDFLLKTQIEFGQGAVTLLILPLYNALRKSQTRTSCLTSLHTSLLQACLIAKAYNIALRVLATPVVEVQPKITNFNIEDYVLFYYYSARVYIGAKQYKNAKRALLECIATPAADEAKSAVAIEAYKYLILVCLLLEGKMPNRDSLPRYVNRRVVETAETLCSEYVTFGKAFERKLSEVGKNGLLDLETLVKENEKLFAKDKTRGLVGQCMNAFVRHRIANQTMTYVTLSLEDLANAAGCVSKQEAETVLLDMISQGEISARVDQSTEVVAFLDEELSESSASGGLMQKIATQTTKMLLIAKSLRDKNESLTANEKYVSKFLPKKKLGTMRSIELVLSLIYIYHTQKLFTRPHGRYEQTQGNVRNGNNQGGPLNTKRLF